MGDTRRFAARMQLVDMEPRGELSSTGYMLAHPGTEYLVLQPSETAEPLRVTLDAGIYTVEWYSVSRRETAEGHRLLVERSTTMNVEAPFGGGGPTVLYLKRVDR